MTSLFGTWTEDWNHVPYLFLPPLPLLDITTLPEEVSKCITCPLTLEPFTDPVVGGDGHTYERGWIEKHLKEKQFSPITRQHMRPDSLFSNISLCKIIDVQLSRV